MPLGGVDVDKVTLLVIGNCDDDPGDLGSKRLTSKDALLLFGDSYSTSGVIVVAPPTTSGAISLALFLDVNRFVSTLLLGDGFVKHDFSLPLPKTPVDARVAIGNCDCDPGDLSFKRLKP